MAEGTTQGPRDAKVLFAGEPVPTASRKGASGPAKRRSRAKVRAMVGSIALAATIAVTVLATQPARAALPVGDLGTAVSNFIFSPNSVAGANNWNCKPSAQHPNPVVLVHATGVNLGANWVALSPMLKNAGYCVYAFNYGMTWLSLGRIGGLGEISASARTLSSFVDKVRSSTGAAKVDMVGHSQGGMMPNYYIKFLGGASKVGTFVGLAPSNHGTTVDGIVNLGSALNVLGFANSILWGVGVPGLQEQEAGSSFQRNLFAGGDTVAGPKYVVIETKYDIVVTPYTNAFLNGPNAKNVLVQDQCPNDNVGHIGMFTDGPVLQNVMNSLGANDPNFRANCTGYGLFL